MNDFVTYLNSTNNIDGNQAGTLAEVQITSEYFKRIQVRRQLGEYITNYIKRNDHHTFILTGHAGDGKTSILIQVLLDLGLLSDGEKLSEQMEYENLYYVKDMSELSREKQNEYFEKALCSPENNKSSILISNTGPLIKAFESFEKKYRGISDEDYSEEDRISLQSKLLKQLDKNSDSTVPFCNHNIFLINVARLDNVAFARRILKNIQSEELWESCGECSCNSQCPIYNNHIFIASHFNQVAQFVENYYRNLFECDKRMTIRQMMCQISYAITANLTCETIQVKYKEFRNPLFYYNFANLFFGYHGIYPDRNSQQISGIYYIHHLGLDKISLEDDFNLFVSEQFTDYFDARILSVLEPLISRTRLFYQNGTEENYMDDKEENALFRQAIRRFYLFYGSIDNIPFLYNRLYGKFFSIYCDYISKQMPKAKLNELRNLIFNALYIKNTGFEPSQDDRLYLTLRRADDVFQNVMLVLGKLSKDNLRIVQKKVNSMYEDQQSKYMLSLKIGEKLYPISYPMICYFSELSEGSISSNSNPSLTHGIATIDTALLEEYGFEKPEELDDCEMTLLINTTSGPKIKKIAIDSDSINIYN